MKTDFDELIESLFQRRATEPCPYGEEQLRRFVDEAIRRYETERQVLADRRVRHRREVARYAAAACVVLLLGCGTYIAVPQNELPEMRASMQIDRQNVPDTITNMLNPNISFMPNEKA